MRCSFKENDVHAWLLEKFRLCSVEKGVEATVSELLMAMLDAGLELLHILEEPEVDPGFWHLDAGEGEATGDLVDWRKNPRVGLPAWLTLVAKKRG